MDDKASDRVTKSKYGFWRVDGAGAFSTEKEARAHLAEVDAAKDEAEAAQRERQSSSTTRVVIGFIAAGVVIGGFLAWWNTGEEERAARAAEKAEIARDEARWATERREVAAAFNVCQKAIVGTAKFGGAQSPPSSAVQAYRAEGALVLRWDSGTFHFKNGFGVDVPQWALCQVDSSSKKIVNLVVTGTVIELP